MRSLIPAQAGNSGKLGRDSPHQILASAGMSERLELISIPHCQRKLAPMPALDLIGGGRLSRVTRVESVLYFPETPVQTGVYGPIAPLRPPDVLVPGYQLSLISPVSEEIQERSNPCLSSRPHPGLDPGEVPGRRRSQHPRIGTEPRSKSLDGRHF